MSNPTDDAPVCPYCDKPAVFHEDSREVYGGRDFGPRWVCPNWPDCDAHCGCHPGTTTPLGTPANGETRQARKAAHAALDPLWKERLMDRQSVYQFLSDHFGRDIHIGEADVETCREIAELSQCKYRELNGDFDDARRLALQHGMRLVKVNSHTLQLHHGRCLLHIYPGNRRLYSDKNRPKFPYLDLAGVRWTLTEVVEKAIETTNAPQPPGETQCTSPN